MTIKEVADLQIDLVNLEVKEKKYKDLLGYSYTEIHENDRIKIEFEIPIFEQKIKEIRKKLENKRIGTVQKFISNW